jgi:hypothetical protein
MADPRNAVSFEGIGYQAATYLHDDTIVYSAAQVNGSASVGLAVSLETAETVTLAGDGEAIEGKLIKVESDGKCVVQYGGFMTLPGGTSATLSVGKKIVGDLLVSAEGYVREVNTATAAELGLCRGRIIDAGTTTAVVVHL